MGMKWVGSLDTQAVEVIYSNVDGNFNEDDYGDDNNNEHDVNKSKSSKRKELRLRFELVHDIATYISD